MTNGPTNIGKDLAKPTKESPGELIFELQKKNNLPIYFAYMLFLTVLHVRSACYKPGACKAFEKRCINECNGNYRFFCSCQNWKITKRCECY